MRLRFTFILACTVLAAAAIAAERKHVDAGVSAQIAQMQEVANSTTLTKAQKIARFKELAQVEATRQMALSFLYGIDPAQAAAAALDIFRNEKTSPEWKLRMGHYLLINRVPPMPVPKDFTKEFAAYLVSQVLTVGEKEFCRPLPDHPTTAVGEYAYLASEFDGYKQIDFGPFKDPRVVPVLVKCLDAPDNVYPANQGDAIHGKPGEPTGRNTARQQIPIALARLGDVRAIEPLKSVLRHGNDIYGRMNAAYALPILVKTPAERAAIGQEILQAGEDLRWARFTFGKGMIEAGDDAGVEFLAVRHAGGYGPLDAGDYSVLYMMNERLKVLKGLKSPKVEGFMREAIAFKPLRSLLLFDPTGVKFTRAEFINPPATAAEYLQRIEPQIADTYAAMLAAIQLNDLKSLSPEIQTIAKDTQSQKLRDLSTATAERLRP